MPAPWLADEIEAITAASPRRHRIRRLTPIETARLQGMPDARAVVRTRQLVRKNSKMTREEAEERRKMWQGAQARHRRPFRQGRSRRSGGLSGMYRKHGVRDGGAMFPWPQAAVSRGVSVQRTVWKPALECSIFLGKSKERWWAMQGLNLRPHPCEGIYIL